MAFGLVMFAIGALLAGVAPAPLFAVVSLLLAAGGFAQGVYVGWGVGHALTIAIVSFVCGQFGYVVGIGARAIGRAKLRPADKTETSRPSSEAGLEKSSAHVNGGG